MSMARGRIRHGQRASAVRAMTMGLFALAALGPFALGCGDETKSASGGEAAETGEATSGIGVAECDEYIEKMAACLDKMSNEAKLKAEPAFKQTQIDWKKAVAEGKDIAPTCKANLKALAANPHCE